VNHSHRYLKHLRVPKDTIPECFCPCVCSLTDVWTYLLYSQYFCDSNRFQPTFVLVLEGIVHTAAVQNFNPALRLTEMATETLELGI
jgi:hypothetical protein